MSNYSSSVMHTKEACLSAYIGAIQLNTLSPVVLEAGVTPEALHLGLIHGRGVVYLQEAKPTTDCLGTAMIVSRGG